LTLVKKIVVSINKRTRSLRNTNKNTTFVLSNKKQLEVKQKTRTLKLTELEFDLIETVRNYKRSYPNGEPEIRYYIEKTFAEYLDEPLED